MLQNARHYTTALRGKQIILIALLALGLRLAYGLAQDHSAPYSETGGDSGWFLANGHALVSNDIREGINLSGIPTAPLYLIFVGLWQVILSPEAAMIAMRIAQAVASTATIYFAYRIGCLLSADERTGLILATVLALAPPFVMEAANIATETLYIFFVAGGLWAYMAAVKTAQNPSRRLLLLAAVLLGLATLTRAVLLLFPLLLGLHLLMLLGWRTGLKRAALLLLVYSLLVSTWTVYNLARWNRLVIGAEGFSAFLFVGAVGWQGPQGVDAALLETTDDQSDTLLNDRDFVAGFEQAVRADPLGYVRRRVGELADAYTQPYGTLFFSGESLKELATDWLKQDRTPGGFLRLLQGDSFWPKLSVFVLHFTALVGGAAGMWLLRNRWRVALPLAAFIAYTTAIHLVFSAIPRYIFPTELFWLAFAAFAVVQVVNHLRTPTPARPAHEFIRADAPTHLN